jgi:diguanylate cyclase (GGDEF)-like protein
MNGSLYYLLVTQHPDQIVPMRCTAPMLGRLARHFEDLVVENNLSALVVQGRCLDGHADEETRRFHRLSAASRYHYVFSCGPNCGNRTRTVPTLPGTTTFEQRDFHEFDTGAFVLVIAPKFSGLLASRRAYGEDGPDAPAYEMVWSFEPNVVYTALDYLHARVAAQHPDHEPEFVSHLRECAPSSASLRLTLDFTTKLALLLQRQTAIETSINRISAMVSSTFDLADLSQGVVDEVAKSLGARRVSLAVWREHGGVPEAVYESTAPPPRAAQPSAPGAPDPIEVPLVARGIPIGLLTVEDDTPARTWEEEEVMMVRTVADQLAVGISNVRLFRKIEEQAITDELTGLFNRRYFFDRLEREIQTAQRVGQPVSLVLLDLDRLKQINDTYGHSAGDTVLRHVGRVMRAVVRNVDVCARYGGEEFVVILPFTDQPGAYLAAERLRTALAAHVLPEVGRVTASFGVSTYPGTAGTSAALLDEADRAMYVAKRSGRNRVAVFGDAAEPNPVDAEQHVRASEVHAKAQSK